MKKVYKYTEYNTNEEFLGGIINFFKGIFKKMAAQIQKLNDDPNTIKDFILKNLLDPNPNSQTSLFKKELDNFAEDSKSKPVDDAACFKLIDSILNKDTGVLGKQGIGTLLADKALQGDNQKTKRITIEYIINTARDQVSKKIGYDPSKAKDTKYITGLNIFKAQTGAVTGATTGNVSSAVVYNYTFMQKIYELEQTGAPQPGAPQPGAPQGAEKPPVAPVAAKGAEKPPVAPVAGAKDDTGAPAPATNEKVETVKKWVTDNIINTMNAYVKAIKEDDIKAAVAKGGASVSEYKVGDVVKYKMKGFNPELNAEQQTDLVNTKKIDKIEGDTYFFTDDKGVPFQKTKEDIIGKAEGNDGPEVVDLKTELAKIKAKPELMTKILAYTKWIEEHPNEPYVEQPTPTAK